VKFWAVSEHNLTITPFIAYGLKVYDLTSVFNCTNACNIIELAMGFSKQVLFFLFRRGNSKKEEETSISLDRQWHHLYSLHGHGVNYHACYKSNLFC